MSLDARLQQWRADCERRIGPPPRRFGWFARFGYLSVPRPSWAHDDQLRVVIDGFRDDILKHGKVVWGRLVQANMVLFKSGPQNAPAEVVYFPAEEPNDLLERLDVIASSLFTLKGTSGNPTQAQAIADHLTAEITRAFGLSVPANISGGKECEISTIYVTRKHLPEGRLVTPFFPLVITPNRPRRVAILPSRYWADGLVRLWSGIPD